MRANKSSLRGDVENWCKFHNPLSCNVFPVAVGEILQPVPLNVGASLYPAGLNPLDIFSLILDDDVGGGGESGGRRKTQTN